MPAIIYVNAIFAKRSGRARALRLVASMLLAGFGAASEAQNVCLFNDYSVAAEFARSDAVIVAKAVSRYVVKDPKDEDEYGGTLYSVVIMESLRGSLHGRITVYSENSSGRFPLEMDQEYLMFLRADGAHLVGDNCGNSGLLVRRQAALVEARRLASHH
jgi:hypothetical protein